MKIISDFKDYYDYGIAFGIDEGIVYERFQTKIHPPKHIENKHGGIIGFCGEFWECKEVSVEEIKAYSWRYRRFGGFKDITYKEKVVDLLEDGWVEGSPKYDPILKDRLIAYYWLKPVENINNMEWNPNRWRPRDYTHWNNWLKGIFTEHSVPLFYVDESNSFETTLNRTIVDFGIQKLMDAVEAFQKLSTFLPSLRPVDTFEMTDEERGRSKGFDEYSFRNKNTKGKPKKF